MLRFLLILVALTIHFNIFPSSMISLDGNKYFGDILAKTKYKTILKLNQAVIEQKSIKSVTGINKVNPYDYYKITLKNKSIIIATIQKIVKQNFIIIQNSNALKDNSIIRYANIQKLSLLKRVLVTLNNDSTFPCQIVKKNSKKFTCLNAPQTNFIVELASHKSVIKKKTEKILINNFIFLSPSYFTSILKINEEIKKGYMLQANYLYKIFTTGNNNIFLRPQLSIGYMPGDLYNYHYYGLNTGFEYAYNFKDFFFFTAIQFGVNYEIIYDFNVKRPGFSWTNYSSLGFSWKSIRTEVFSYYSYDPSLPLLGIGFSLAYMNKI